VRKELRLLVATIAGVLALSGVALAADITGDDNDNRLKGTKDADTINALGGNDTVFSRGGDDVVNGGDGNDRIRGGRHADTLNGDAGDDRINGRGDGRTADTINCGEGNDVVKAGRNDVVGADCETVRVPGKGKPYAINPGRGKKPKKDKKH
jgi:Ca2+-binding RTX toxin-like protein